MNNLDRFLLSFADKMISSDVLIYSEGGTITVSVMSGASATGVSTGTGVGRAGEAFSV